MKVIHIIFSLGKINFGVWNAAIFAHEFMHSTYRIESELWICSPGNPTDAHVPIPHFFYKKQQLNKKGFLKWLESYPAKDTVIVSHGAWLKPAKLGFWAAQKGYKWIYTPQGMLENYTTIENGKKVKHIFNKGLNKKWLYYCFFEKRYIRKASAVRAVSETEQGNLNLLFKRKIELIYNGTPTNQEGKIEKSKDLIKVLFLSRLHSKKGIIYLIQAWHEVMSQNNKFRLIIAGPDEGELEKIKPYFTNNVEYVGSVYGDDKIILLREANYYILPSFSEGFPTSLVEAMGYGAIPIASEGCNFPAIFELNLGYKVEPEKESIVNVLNKITNIEYDFGLSKSNMEYIEKNLTEKRIAADYYQLYSSVLNNK